MRRVKFAEALDRGEGWPHQEQIGKELVLPARRQVAIVRGIVSEDQQRLLARTDQHDGDHI